MGRFTRRQKIFIFLFVLIASFVLLGSVLLYPVGTHLRAASLLLRFSNPNATGVVAGFAHHPFQEEDGSAQTPHGPLRYRLYVPRDVRNPGGIVLLHGVHHLGIEDPRLWNLARALAGAGVLVMTPQLEDLADYRVTARTIDVIGDSEAFRVGKRERDLRNGFRMPLQYSPRTIFDVIATLRGRITNSSDVPVGTYS